MTDTIPTPKNPVTVPVPAEHASEIRLLDSIKHRIIAGHDRTKNADHDWIEGSLEVAAALRDGRDAISSDVAFSDWLKTNDLNFYSHQDRAALINLAGDIDLARTVLQETDSRSYRLIWEKTKDRFTNAGKPAGARRLASPRSKGAATSRAMKLGENTVANPKFEDDCGDEIARLRQEIQTLKVEIQDLKAENAELRERDALTLSNRLAAIAAARAEGRDEFGGLDLKGKERARLREADKHLDAAEFIYCELRNAAGLRPGSKLDVLEADGLPAACRRKTKAVHPSADQDPETQLPDADSSDATKAARSTGH